MYKNYKRYYYEIYPTFTDHFKRKLRKLKNEESTEISLENVERVNIANSNVFSQENSINFLQCNNQVEITNENHLVYNQNKHSTVTNSKHHIPRYCDNEDKIYTHHNIFSKYSFADEYWSQENTGDVLTALKDDNRECDAITNLLSQKGFFDPVSMVVDKTPVELLLMALKFSLMSCVPHCRVANVMQMVNCICNDRVLPDTRYLIDQLCNPQNNITFYCICTECSKILGKFGDLEESIICDVCNTNMNTSHRSNICYFCVIDPSESIREHLELNEDYYNFVLKRRVSEPNVIKDVYDGRLYRKFVENLPTSDKQLYVTTTLNTDGAPIFKSSNCSIYPVYLMINELPVQYRLDNTILTALWVGPGKPEMSSVFHILVDLLNPFSTIGIQCKINNVEVIIKMFVLMACADTIARNQMNGTIQFNGEYGCDWCLQKGVNHNHSNRYPYKASDQLVLREKLTHIIYANEALRTKKPCFGVKFASPLLLLNGFDISKSFIVEYLHCVPYGVVCQLTENMLDQMSEEDIKDMDNMLLSIRVPNQLCRLTRPIKYRSDWKAREWESWLLYYSLPVLSCKIKDKRYIKHWSLLVEAVYICLKDSIGRCELNYVSILLNQFVLDVKKLYSLSDMTYNVHLLLHIPQCIEDWGPLWAYSAFCFESANHDLLKAIKSANGVILQVVRQINLQRFVRKLERVVYSSCSPVVTKCIENFNYSRSKHCYKLYDITYFGTRTHLSSSESSIFEMSRSTYVYSKIVHKGCCYQSYDKDNSRSCDGYAILNNGSFVQIIEFLVDEESKKEKTRYYLVRTRLNKYVHTIKEVINVSKNSIIVPTADIASACILMDIKKKTYIAPVPNSYFY